MTEEMLLVREYCKDASQEAFAKVVERYVDAVYAAARRQVGDGHLAEDVTQAVFIVLAQKAKSLDPNRSLLGWLLKTTTYCAGNARRARTQRETHERKAGEMATNNRENRDADWQELTPLLDEGLNKLRAGDRDALLLRFFDRKSFGQVGEAMGISEDAAAKRVERAVERLRGFFRRRGAVVSAAALAGALAAESAQAAPPALAGTIAASGATSGSAAAMAKGAMMLMAAEKTKTVVIAAIVLVLGLGGGVVIVHSVASAPKTRTVQLSAAPASKLGIVTYRDGTTVQAIGITELPSAPITNVVADALGLPHGIPPQAGEWWGPDGSPVAAISLARFGYVWPGEAKGRRQVRFILSMRGPAVREGNVSIRIDGAAAFANSSDLFGDEMRYNHCASLPEALDVATIHIGLATGAWREDAMQPVGVTSAATKASGAAIFGAIRDGKPGYTAVDMNFNRMRDGRDWNVVAFLTDGRKVSAGESSSDGSGRGTMTFQCRKEQIARLVWLTRPYEWQTMTLALKPAPAPTTRVASGK